jgi:hypothetical protein
MNRNTFQCLIRRILNEEVEKQSSTDVKVFNRLPEVVHDKDYKEIIPYKRDTRTKDELLDDLTKIVKGIDSEYTIVWDDHDDISISARDMFRIRIVPRWENNYAIEAFTRNEDRIFITGQTWDQVKEFVKSNLKKSDTCVDKSLDKIIKNRKDQTSTNDKGLNQKDKPELKPLTNEPQKTSKNKEKDFSEDQTKKEADLPEKPMKEVSEFKKQIDHKVQDPVRLRKRKPDTKLTVKMT